jgi:hypothetical protein
LLRACALLTSGRAGLLQRTARISGRSWTARARKGGTIGRAKLACLNVRIECGLAEGRDRGELCPFQYWAERDVADFAHIPWRNRRFDPDEVARAVETVERAQQEFDTWQLPKGQRTLGFCSAVTHADFMATFFTARGV